MNDETLKDTDTPAEEMVGEPVAGSSVILSDDEVGALLDGVASGEVEICSSSGTQLASVTEYVVPARSQLISKRLPNLDKLVERLAERVRVQVRERLGCVVAVAARESTEIPYEFNEERNIEPIIAVQFSAAPMAGHGAILIEPELINRFVESFFGGSFSGTAAARGEGITPGERRVTDHFAALVLESLQALWQPLQAFEPAVVKVESSAHLLEIASDADAVVCSGIDFSFAETDAAMHLLMPSAMIASFLPYLRGVDRDEDPAKDKLWSDTIRSGLQGVDVGVEVTVGDVTMTLADLICLQPGDVISIDNPRDATLRAQGTPLMSARFGVHAGRNAVEATAWLNNKE